MKIERLDHLVLTVRDVEATCAFYSRVLQMEPVTFAGGRRALGFAQQKLNLHPADAPISPHALHPTPDLQTCASSLRRPLMRSLRIFKVSEFPSRRGLFGARV